MTAVLTESGRVLHRTLLYSYTEYTQCFRESDRTLLYSQRMAECFTEHCCTHREWQSASQNAAVFTESVRELHRTLLYSQSGRVLRRTLLYSQRVAECFTEHCCTHRVAECFIEHCCTHREWQSASQNTAVLECFTEHCCTHRE